MGKKAEFERNGEPILLDVQGLQNALQCGRPTAIKIAREAGAEVRVGRKYLYHRKKLEMYLENVNEL